MRYCTKANGTKDDDDWFKFILPDNSDSYLSFIPDSGVYDITVYDENKNVMGKNDYPSVYNKTIYNLKIQEEGTYYLKITCKVRGSYKFMVGNPNYTIGDNNLSLGSLSLVKGTDYETYRDYSKLSAVPPRAIVYQIDLNGGSSTLTEARQVRPFASTSWINSSKYVWQANLSITDTNRFHQSWYFKYIPHKSGSFNASARFYYVYPVLPADETE